MSRHIETVEEEIPRWGPWSQGPERDRTSLSGVTEERLFPSPDLETTFELSDENKSSSAESVGEEVEELCVCS